MTNNVHFFLQLKIYNPFTALQCEADATEQGSLSFAKAELSGHRTNGCKAICTCVLRRFSHVRLFVTPLTVDRQALLSIEFSRQEYWSGLPCPPPEDLCDPGTEPVSPELQVDSLLLSHRETQHLSDSQSNGFLPLILHLLYESLSSYFCRGSAPTFKLKCSLI